MYALNRIELIGHLTETPALRSLPNGTSVTDLNIKTTEQITKADGSNAIISSYHNVTLWRRMAEVAADYCKAGSQIYIAGRLKTESWETDGQKKYKTKVIADDLILLDSRKEITPAPESSAVAGGLNNAQILGNITRDPELRQTTTGQHVANFSIATNRKWQDRNTGDQKEEVEYHNVVAWGDLAREISENVKTGQKLYAQGRVQTRSWDTPEGEKKYTTEITAEKVLQLGAKNADLASGDTGSAAPAAAATATTAATAETADAAAPDIEIPEIKYESDIKPEDLPF
jgi:single-strand DNA-binding protein